MSEKLSLPDNIIEFRQKIGSPNLPQERVLLVTDYQGPLGEESRLAKAKSKRELLERQQKFETLYEKDRMKFGQRSTSVSTAQSEFTLIAFKQRRQKRKQG